MNTFEEDFEAYLTRYCTLYGYSRETAMQHRLVLDVREYYKETYEKSKEGER